MDTHLHSTEVPEVATSPSSTSQNWGLGQSIGDWPGTSDLPPSIEHGAPLASDPMLAGRPLTLGRFLQEVAILHADREAIVTSKERVTYGALLNRSLLIARSLVASGAGMGTKVAILLPNGPEWVAAFFGITMVGGIAVALNTFAARDDLQYMLAQSDSQIVLTSSSLSTHHPALAPGVVLDRYAELPALVATFHMDDDALVTMGRKVTPELVDALHAQVTPETDALIMFTSGSTGRPKVVLHMHRAICIASWRWWHLEHRSSIDRVFSTSPFFWSSGLTRTLGGTLAAGAALVLQEHFEPGEALKLLESEKVTSILLARAPRSPYVEPSRLRGKRSFECPKDLQGQSPRDAFGYRAAQRTRGIRDDRDHDTGLMHA